VLKRTQVELSSHQAFLIKYCISDFTLLVLLMASDGLIGSLHLSTCTGIFLSILGCLYGGVEIYAEFSVY